MPDLGALRAFPFDGLKIDHRFMCALSTDPKARALVEAMLGMARALGLEAVCEGVEPEEQLTLLRSLRCRTVQGFGFDRPMAAEAMRRIIATA